VNRPRMLPDDAHNRALLDNVHPLVWTNPMPEGVYNIVVIGGGTAGLITAAVASSMGARTALIERGFLGGDCLNVGCVPSKALIRGARGQAELSWLRESGLLEGGPSAASGGSSAPADPRVAFPAVMERLRRIRATISSHDSAARYRDEFGVDVYVGEGRFTGKRTVAVTGDDGSVRDLRFAKAVIATGARAAAPPIPGLDATPYLTNENLFTLTELPESLVVIGAGPIGCEMAQSFARLGSRVELVEMAPRVLPREDPDVAAVIQAELERAGVTLHLGAAVAGVSGDAAAVTVRYRGGMGASATTGASASAGETGADGSGTGAPPSSGTGAPDADREVRAERLLVAIGRAPNLDGLDLERAGVRSHPRGVEVNDHLQTANKRIFAAGDVASPYQFTHMAEAMASLVVQNALFLPTGTVSRLTVPWSTYTSPEVAHVGISEQEAARQGIAVDVYRHEMTKVDRARLDGETGGFVKIIAQRGKTKILGATIVAAHAGEMISEIVLAMQNGLGIDRLTSVIHPYPTEAEAIKRAAAGYLRNKLTPRVKRIFAVWFRWSRR
jgi:pyruvate/2-oxoglutarate dehydrogenase complex dihydrolipoamide dehydrogenase (E3) component